MHYGHVIWFSLLLLCSSMVVGEERGDVSQVFIRDGKVWYAPSAHPISSDATGKLQPELSPDGRKVLLADTGSRQDNLGAFHITVIGLDGRTIFQKNVTGSDGPVGSILSAGWVGDDEIFVELELGPSVSEMQVISLKEGKIVKTYHGSEFIWDAGGTAVASKEYVPTGEPEDKIVDSVLVNDKNVYELSGSRADGYSIVSNLVWSHTEKPESLYFVERKGDGSRSLVCLSVSSFKEWNSEKAKVSKTVVETKADEVTVSLDDKTGKAMVK